MLVGHEPNMSATIGHLVGGARLDLKKGGLACIDLPDPASRAGALLWLIPPKVPVL
jgi:phosphohistidine phosphatase SixA